MALLFITGENNVTKLLAVEIALQTLFTKHAFAKQKVRTSKDVRPTTRQETYTGALESALALLANVETHYLHNYDEIFAIGIQKGTTLLDSFPPMLFCNVTLVSNRSDEPISADSTSVPLPPKAKALALDGMPLYDIYRKILGDAVADKGVSLYETLTGEPEHVWIAEAVKKALLPFRTGSAQYFGR